MLHLLYIWFAVNFELCFGTCASPCLVFYSVTDIAQRLSKCWGGGGGKKLDRTK